MSTKRKLRGVLDRSALMTGVMQWCEARMHRGFTALMYHRVLPDAEALSYPFRSLAMPESAFAVQVRWLAEHFTVLPMRECIETQRAGTTLERPLVAVTFDDGYVDNATIAAPLLEEVGVRGTFFATSEFLRTGEPLWFDLLALAFANSDREAFEAQVAQTLEIPVPQFGSLSAWMDFAKSRTDRERQVLLHAFRDRTSDLSASAPMSLEQLRALHGHGHEIGAHSLTHPLLPDCDDVTLKAELVESRSELESWLDTEITGLAYPNGDCDERVIEATKAAGYQYACTTSPGLNVPGADSHLLARLDVTRDRVFDSKGRFDQLAFRSEICRVRRFLRAG